MLKKLKSFIADDAGFSAVLIVLVGVLSFGLGRQSVLPDTPRNSAPAAVSVTERALPALQAANPADITTSNADLQVVASKSGSKYHLPECPGAKQMKPENEVWFASRAAAEAAGYTAAANCNGL